MAPGDSVRVVQPGVGAGLSPAALSAPATGEGFGGGQAPP